MAKHCPECGVKLPYESAKFCPECGTRQAIEVNIDGDVKGDVLAAGRDINVEANVGELRDCKYCGGTGKIKETCPRCKGRGELLDGYLICTDCIGGYNYNLCSECKGQGQVRI